MKKRILYPTLCVFGLLVFASAVIDNDWLTAVLEKLDNARVKYPQEKVHLQLDKPYYSMGDDVWLKAYVVNSENNELSAMSKILYIDFVDDRDSVHKTLTLPVTNGLSNGDVKLTDSIFSAGNYRIKAYTRWMQNFSSDLVFDKEIMIGDARKGTSVTADAHFNFSKDRLSADVTYLNVGDRTPVAGKHVTYNFMHQGKGFASGKAVTDGGGKITIQTQVKEEFKPADLYLQTTLTPTAGNIIKRNFLVYNPALRPDVQFFPEGGRLVAGLRSKIGFKAVLPNGNGADVKGYIVDQQNKSVTEFTSAHAGMGVFVLQPLVGSSYTAVIKTSSGAEERYALPQTELTGYVLGADHTGDDSITVKVAATKDLGSKEVALLAMQNGVVKYTTKLNLANRAISTRLPELRFNTGIVQFTLLAADASPLAERLVFVDHNDQLKMEVSNLKGNYGKREKVELQFNLKDDEDNPVEGNFSVAVTDDNKVAFDDDSQTGIFANLLLTSDLKGYIEKPNYYFNAANKDRAKHLDYLLLTQGWRRFSWADIKARQLKDVAYQPQESLGITGMVTSLTGKPVVNGKVNVYGNSANLPIIVDTVTDAYGKFIVKDLDFAGDVKFVVRVKNAKDKDNVRIKLDYPPKQVYAMQATRDGELSNSVINYLKTTQKRFEQFKDGIPGKSIMLKQVDIRDTKLVNKYTVKGSSKLGSGDADIVIQKEKVSQYMKLYQAFYGLAGIEVKPNGDIYRIGRVVSITTPGGKPMAVYLDGIPINPTLLKEIPPASVEGIEIFKSMAATTIYGNDGYWGVIQITTRNGPSDFDAGPSSYLGRILVKGFSAQREFYSPVYDKAGATRDADQRSTIYWQPNVVTDADGKARLTYYTADEPGTHRVIAEGIDLDGKLVRKVFTYEVQSAGM